MFLSPNYAYVMHIIMQNTPPGMFFTNHKLAEHSLGPLNV